MTTSRALRLAAAAAAALVAGSAAWILGGNALAARRELDGEREWEKTFGSRAALVRKYTVAESNATARRVEEIGREMGFELAPQHGRAARFRPPLPEDERGAIREYVDAELARQAGPVAPPTPRVIAILNSRRDALSAFEEILSSAPSPLWACDPSGSPEDWPRLPFASHMLLQRLLVADGLTLSSKGEEAGAARALEASWALNKGLASRPDLGAHMVAIAASRLQAGALRRIGGSVRTWAPRLEEMGARRRLVDALVLEHRDGALRRVSLPNDVGWWHVRAAAALWEPVERWGEAEFVEGLRATYVSLRDAPAFREGPDAPPGRGDTKAMMAVFMPNIRNAFDRADRLALDAELTSKILRMKEARRSRGAWPPPSADCASSRFPGLAWTCRVDGDAMTISLNRALPPPAVPKTSLVLPLSFSSSPPRP